MEEEIDMVAKLVEKMIDGMISDNSFLNGALDSIDIIIKDGYATADDRLGKCLILLKGIVEGRTQMLARLRKPYQPFLEAKYVLMESGIFKSKAEEIRQKLLKIIAKRYEEKDYHPT